MILFFGTRPGNETSEILNGATCPYCHQKGTITKHTRSHWFHLFWIKLFKVATDEFGECSHCKRGFYKDELAGMD